MRLAALLLCLSLAAAPAAASFTDVTVECGLGGVAGSKLAWGDYNRDGFEDLLVQGSRLFRNNGPPQWTFTEVSDSAGISGTGACGGVWGDYNNDGRLDIYSNCCGYGNDILWMNNGDGTFTDVTAAAGNPCDTFPSEGVAWGDYDNDGFIDLYVANYENWDLDISYPDFLWHNLGNGTFSDCTDSAGVAEAMRSRGVCWADYDGDSQSDIYVSNYRLMPNHLWDNQGNGTFLQEAFNKGVAGTEFGGCYGHTIASAWGDLNNDGYMDLFAANLAHKDPPRGPYCDDSYLFMNNGPPVFDFTDVRSTSGIEIHPVGATRDGYYWDELHDGVSLGDYDNDGYLDMCVTQVYDIPFAYSFLYLNDGDETFTDVTLSEGVRVWDGWAPAWCDFDRDGDLDLVEYGSDAYPIVSHEVHLYRNDRDPGNYLEIVLSGEDCNRAAIGALARLWCDGQQQVRQVEGGTGNTCQNSLGLEFGLGSFDIVDSLLVIWPCGRVERVSGIRSRLHMTRSETGPWITQGDVSPYHLSPQDTVLVRARTFDETGIASVWAFVEKPDEKAVDSLELYDDGFHGDGAAGDSNYGGYYETPPAGGTFVVDVSASDGASATLVDNIGCFTSLGPVGFFSALISDSDTIPSPGDTFRLTVVLENSGSEPVRGIGAALTGLSPHVSVVQERALFGDIPGLDTVSSSEFEVALSLFCPHNEELRFELDITDSMKPAAEWVDTFSLFCFDDEPPRLSSPRPSPRYLPEGDTVAILARIAEGSGLATASATVESPVGNPVATIDLFDDGLHGDSLAGDHLYGNVWETPAWTQAFYNVNLNLVDGQSNTVQHTNLMEFSTVPFVTAANMLLVDDDNYNHPLVGSATFYEEYYRQSLASNGHSYDYWDVFCYGSPDTGVLNRYEIIIWETGTTTDSFPCLRDWECSSSLSPLEQDNLKAYLTAGGRLFISSQGIADFWEGPMRAMLRIQGIDYSVASETLDGVQSNPIGDGLSFAISGGSGADNQYVQSAIRGMSLSYPVLDYRGQSGKSGGTMCYVASLWAAVTFGFGFEAIAEDAARDTVMARVIGWLTDPVTVLEPDARGSPKNLELAEPRPNPCAHRTVLDFGMPPTERAEVSVYNSAGQRVRTLFLGRWTGGRSSLTWDCNDSQGRPVTSGTYFCKLEAQGETRVKKVVLVRR